VRYEDRGSSEEEEGRGEIGAGEVNYDEASYLDDRQVECVHFVWEC
jgi:hypothetical protein